MSYSNLAGTVAVETLVPIAITLPASCVGNSNVQAGAGIQASKLQHVFHPVYGQPGGSASTTERKVVSVVRGATATALSFAAGVRTACSGGATLTVDLLKNGTSILTGTVSLSSATAYSVNAGTLSSTSLVAGDVLEVSVTATAGGGTVGSGVFAVLSLAEDYA